MRTTVLENVAGVFVVATVFAAALIVPQVAQVATAAGGASWCGTGTTGRGQQSWPPTGAVCRLSQCRVVGAATGKVQPCDGGNPNCIGGSGLIAYKAVVGTFIDLPACPAWTATSTWNAPQ